MKIKLWLRPLIHYTIFFKVGMLQWWTVVLVTTEACLKCVPEVNDKFETISDTPGKKATISGLNEQYKKKTHLWGVIVQGVDQFAPLVSKWVDILEKHINKSNIPEELCPNMCGLLQRRVMDCKTCKYKIHSCPSLTGKVDCGGICPVLKIGRPRGVTSLQMCSVLPVHMKGKYESIIIPLFCILPSLTFSAEYKIQAVERDQVLLDCFQQWHSLMIGRAFYIWTNGTKVIKGDSDETSSTLRSFSDDSKLVLNQIRLSDKGTYRCTLKNSRTVFFRTVMHVTVIKGPIETQPPNVTMPTLLSEDTEIVFQSSSSVSLVLLMAVITALCLAGSLILIVAIGKRIIQKRKMATQSTRVQEEENNIFTSLWARWQAK
ncbi:izumo sperm-egg fusion protein 1 isoform X2 [Syngnathus scovelli]|uniref:izumo sperm-egg fusion protein 1 isoform X2 n=1 Tax=Syngnathus scovelli TaxID=161590 RepID=UPI00210F619F|nr:izumo sperm-egg fusion protein 1 isoform X2 [Syngnathus scovelli]